VWIAEARDEAIVSSKLRFAIERAFRANGIAFPMTKSEVHVLERRAS
jgi:small-conductance mechanosensitive channel